MAVTEAAAEPFDLVRKVSAQPPRQHSRKCRDDDLVDLIPAQRVANCNERVGVAHLPVGLTTRTRDLPHSRRHTLLDNGVRVLTRRRRVRRTARAAVRLDLIINRCSRHDHVEHTHRLRGAP